MRRSRGRLEQTTLALSAACLAIVATYGCRDATQVTLVLSTSKIACGALAGVRITVAGERLEAERRASGDFVTATATCPAPSSQDVGTLVITPGSSNSAAVVIVAGIGRDARSCNQANGYKGCVVARRSLSFIDHVSATVPVLIDPTCVDVPCDVASTCKRGTCVSAQLECKEDGSCEPTDPRARDGDASAPIDGASDGTAETDSGADALVDGSASDASEGGPSGACNFMCPDPMPPGQQCSGGQACCHALTSGAGGFRGA